jgi:tetratricopeptide (TPR) repeat protein
LKIAAAIVTPPRPLSRLLVVLAAAALLPGCASLGGNAARTGDSAVGTGQPGARAPVALTSDLMYKLMRAELEFQAGNWQAPYMALMALARQTGDARLAQRASEMARAARQQTEALAAVRLWRELDPSSEDASQYYLGFVVMADRLDEAEQLLRVRLAEAEPPKRAVLMFHAQQYLSLAKDKERASATLNRLLAPYAGTMEAHLVLAQNALGQGARAEAAKHAQAALKLQPGSELALLTMAQMTPDLQDLRKLYENFLTVNPGGRQVRTAYARLLMAQKEPERARQQLLTLLRDEPEDAATLYALGLLAMQTEDRAGAEGYFVKFIEVLEKDPDDERDPSRVLILLAQLAEERGDLKAAQTWLEQVNEADSGLFLASQLKRAQLISKGGDLQAARSLLASINATDESAQAQVVLAEGQLLRNAGNFKEAFAIMESGVQRFSSNADLLYDFALVAEKLGKHEVMERSLRNIIKSSPEHAQAYNALGYSLADRNIRLEEARELIAKALQLAPEDPFIMDSMGWVLYRLGDLDQAEHHLRRAYTLRNDVEIAVHLAEVLWKKGEKADAHKLLREARARDPKNDTLKDTLARLHLKL